MKNIEMEMGVPLNRTYDRFELNLIERIEEMRIAIIDLIKKVNELENKLNEYNK